MHGTIINNTSLAEVTYKLYAHLLASFPTRFAKFEWKGRFNLKN